MNQTGDPGVAVEGEVVVVTYENRETGFRIVKLQPEGKRERITLVGVIPSLGPGSWVRARGTWENNPTHGPQLRVGNVLVLAPTTLAGIEKYLSSGVIKGIGLATAQKIVKQFGVATLKVLEEHPERVREVAGLGKARADALVQAWNEHRALHEVMVFLHAHGASMHLANRIFKRYGERAVAIVSTDPYRLAIDVRGIGFRTADRIAAELGIGQESPRRSQAALLQSLRDATDAGHCYLVGEDLLGRAAKLVAPENEVAPPDDATLERLEAALAASVTAGIVVAEERETLAPTTALRTAALYDTRMLETEQRVAARLAALASAEGHVLAGYETAIERYERETGTVLADEQREAVAQAARAPLLVVTGGPGVGKTTIVKAILSVFDRAGVTVSLAAPTGRAAKRMSEATGKEAMTLHRLLEFDPKTGKFKRDRANPLDARALVVDESSMVDIWMADAVTQAVADGARLILVGDVDQLPSVGPGSVLRDAIASGIVPTVRLVKIFRQAEQSLIVQNAHRINAGEPPLVPEKGTEADFFVMDRRDPDEARNVIVDLVTRHIPRKFGLDPVRDIQVLTPMNRGPAGTIALNEQLQSVLNPGPAWTNGKPSFRAGDKVMQLRNDYDKNVYNGDVGVIARVDGEGVIVVRFDEREVPYEPGAVEDLALAYACTVHKSQGSEYPAVVIPMLTTHFVMLSKNLLYTAVTRGKRLVVLVADPRALKLALADDRDRHAERQTKLALRTRMAHESAHA